MEIFFFLSFSILNGRGCSVLIRSIRNEAQEVKTSDNADRMISGIDDSDKFVCFQKARNESKRCLIGDFVEFFEQRFLNRFVEIEILADQFRCQVLQIDKSFQFTEKHYRNHIQSGGHLMRNRIKTHPSSTLIGTRSKLLLFKNSNAAAQVMFGVIIGVCGNFNSATVLFHHQWLCSFSISLK